MSANVRIDTAIADKIIANLMPKADKIVRETAFRIEDKGKRQVVVDTGALRSSIYVKSSKNNGYQKAVSAALEKNKEASAQPDDFPNPKEGEAIIGSSMEYALWIEIGRRGKQGEDGTTTGGMPARPYLVPAAESERADFERKLKDVGKYG